MTDVVTMLQTYGPWAVCVFEAVAIVAMARYIVKEHARDREDGKLFTAALVSTRDAMKEMRGALERSGHIRRRNDEEG